MMKRITWYVCGVLTVLATAVFAAKNSDNIFTLGDKSATTKKFIGDVGDGANNPEIQMESGSVTIGNVPLADSIIENSDIDLGAASNSSRLTVSKGATATLSGLDRKEGTLFYDTDTQTLKFDDGTSLITIEASSGAIPWTNWTAYTPAGSISWTSIVSTAYYRRIGDTLEISIGIDITGAPSGDLSFSSANIFPPTLVIDEDKIGQLNGDRTVVGQVTARDLGGSPDDQYGWVYYDDSANLFLFSGESTDQWSTSQPFSWTVSDELQFNIRVPIVGWDVP